MELGQVWCPQGSLDGHLWQGDQLRLRAAAQPPAHHGKIFTSGVLMPGVPAGQHEEMTGPGHLGSGAASTLFTRLDSLTMSSLMPGK